MSTVFLTASSLDGFLADPDDSLAWLLRQHQAPAGEGRMESFGAGVGAHLMGSATYAWMLRHVVDAGEPWPYSAPTWVMTRRTWPVPTGADVRFAAGDVVPVVEQARREAGGRTVWVMGGGELVGQVADAGLLDELVVSFAPVTLGAGKPLLPRRLELELVATERDGDLVEARYRVLGPLLEDRDPADVPAP